MLICLSINGLWLVEIHQLVLCDQAAIAWFTSGRVYSRGFFSGLSFSFSINLRCILFSWYLYRQSSKLNKTRNMNVKRDQVKSWNKRINIIKDVLWTCSHWVSFCFWKSVSCKGARRNVRHAQACHTLKVDTKWTCG